MRKPSNMDSLWKLTGDLGRAFFSAIFSCHLTCIIACWQLLDNADLALDTSTLCRLRGTRVNRSAWGAVDDRVKICRRAISSIIITGQWVILVIALDIANRRAESAETWLPEQRHKEKSRLQRKLFLREIVGKTRTHYKWQAKDGGQIRFFFSTISKIRILLNTVSFEFLSIL